MIIVDLRSSREYRLTLTKTKSRELITLFSSWNWKDSKMTRLLSVLFVALFALTATATFTPVRTASAASHEMSGDMKGMDMKKKDKKAKKKAKKKKAKKPAA